MSAAPVSVYVCNLPLSVTDADLDKWIRRETQGKVTPLSVFIVYERSEAEAARGGRGRGASTAVSRSVSAPRARGIAFVSVLPSQASACLALNGCEMGGRILGLRVAIPRGSGDKFTGNADPRSININSTVSSSSSSSSSSRGAAAAASVRGRPLPRQPQYKPIDAKSWQPAEPAHDTAAPAAAASPSFASTASSTGSPSSSASPTSFAAVASASAHSAVSSSFSSSTLSSSFSFPSLSPPPPASPVIAAAASASGPAVPSAAPTLSSAITWPQLPSAKPVLSNPSSAPPPPGAAAALPAPATTVMASSSASAPPRSASSPAPSGSGPDLRELLQCPICCEAYNNVSRVPQLVHSNHTVCSACIDGVSDYGEREPYACPMCRTLVSLAERVNNTLVCDMVELMSRQQQQQRQPVVRPRPPSLAATLQSAAFTAVSLAPTHGASSRQLLVQDELEIEESKEREAFAHHPAWQPPSTVSPAPVDSNALAELETLCSAAAGLSLRQSDGELLSKAEAQRVNAAAASFLASSFCLANRRLFPAIDSLPHADDPVVFTQHNGRLAMQHHTFVCELLCRSSSPLVLGVRDRDGKLIVVDFRQRDGHEEHRVDVSQLRLGHTVCVRYATVSAFADGQWGVKAEHPQLCKALPMSIAEVDRLDGERARKAFFDRVYGSSCALCDGRPAVTVCPRCRVLNYCSRECQQQDWSEHRSKCRLWQLMAEVYELPLEAVTPQPFVNSLAVPI